MGRPSRFPVAESIDLDLPRQCLERFLILLSARVENQ